MQSWTATTRYTVKIYKETTEKQEKYLTLYYKAQIKSRCFYCRNKNE